MPAAPPTAAAICGVPGPRGSLAQLPQVEMSSLPVNDQGRHELILRVSNAKERFCYRYSLGGVEQTVAPVIRVHRGEKFAIRIVNEIKGPAKGAEMAAGALAPCAPAPMMMQKPRVFTGYLNHPIYARAMAMPPLDVNLHLHGFQGPASQENVFLSTLSTPAHACEYNITIPKTQPIGTYFYHPHAHGMSDDEVAGGLAGMWIVEPDSPQIAAQDEHEIVLQYRVPYANDDDNFLPPDAPFAHLALKHQAALKDPPLRAYDAFDPPPWPSTVPVRAGGFALPQCGVRQQSVMVVNGGELPAALTVPAGQPQLLRLLNATSDDFVLLRMRDSSGHERALRIVGRDGVPVSGDSARPFARYIAMNGIDLVPTNRADVLVTLKPGEVLTLFSDYKCLGMLDDYALRHDVLTIAAGPPASAPSTIATQSLPRASSPAVQLLRYVRAHPKSVRRRALTYTAYALPNAGKKGAHTEFYITETSNPRFTEKPYWPQYAKGALTPQPDIVVKRGSIEEWFLFNATLEPHTFHIHQMAFVAEDESPQPVMLDTILVPVGKTLPNKSDPAFPLIKPGVTHIVLDFRNVPRGTFLFHCHMLFHEDRGMMGIVKVI